MPIQRRPNFWAAAIVVPHPQKGSSTTSQGLLLAWIMRSSRARGFWVGAMNDTMKIDPKPALVHSEQGKQDELLEGEPIEAMFPGKIDRRIPVAMPAEQFLAWFPNRVYDMYAHWRR